MNIVSMETIVESTGINFRLKPMQLTQSVSTDLAGMKKIPSRLEMVPQCAILLITWVFLTGFKLSEATILPKIGNLSRSVTASSTWEKALKEISSSTMMGKKRFKRSDLNG